MPFDSAARKPGSEHDSIGDDWGNSEFQWEGRWSNTDVLLFTETSVHREWARTYARCRSQRFRSMHRQQHHSIIPVERQSIYCWLTGIQSPFPKGLEKKNGMLPVKKPTPTLDWWDKSGTGSWGILYCNKHTIKNLWWQTAQEEGLLSYPCIDNAFVALFGSCQECVFHCKVGFGIQASEAH